MIEADGSGMFEKLHIKFIKKENFLLKQNNRPH